MPKDPEEVNEDIANGDEEEEISILTTSDDESRQNLDVVMRSRTKIVMVPTLEERRFLLTLLQFCDEKKRKLVTWSHTAGAVVMLSHDSNGNELAKPTMWSPVDFLKYVAEDNNLPHQGTAKKRFGGGAVYVMFDLPNWWPATQGGGCAMQDSEIKTLRLLRDIVSGTKEMKGKQIFIVSRDAFIPPDMKNIITVLDWSLPTFATIRNHIQILVDKYIKRRKQMKLGSFSVDDDGLDLISRSFQGLSLEEVDSIFRQTAVRNLDFDVQTFIDCILKAKKDLIRKANVGLEIVDTTDLDLKAVGGLAYLKDFIVRREGSFSERARQFGLPAPRGILLIGVQGCGKSLVAKVIGREWNLPVLRLDVGAMFEGLVGASESNTRRALQVAEAMAPCVTGRTRILMSGGAEISAEDLYHSISSGKPSIIGFDGKEFANSSIVGITKKPVGDHGCFRITTAAGRFERTGNHRMMTRDGWKEVSEIEIGEDWVAVRIGPVPSIPDTIAVGDHLPDNIRLVGGEYRSGKGGWKDSVVPKIPSAVDERCTYLLGLAMADGTIRRKSVVVGSSDQKILDFFSHSMFEMFGKLPCEYDVTKPGTVSEKRDGSKILTVKMNRQSVFSSVIAGSFFRSLSEHILEFPENLMLSWLRGFIQGDGCVMPESNRVCVTQERKELRELISSVLRRLGFPRRFSGKNIFITGYDEYSSIMSKLRSVAGCDDDKVAMAQEPTPKRWSFTRGVEKDGENPNIVWARITDIEPMPETNFVYDLHCSDPHTYIGDGAIDHNCVMWIDEIDKSLSGVSSSDQSDAGTTARVFQTILTWMQEKKAAVYVAGTANRVISFPSGEPILPPEMLRKGRFDEIFFVDLPDLEERKQILKIHISKQRSPDAPVRNPDDFDLDQLAQASHGYSGAEIEAAIIEGLNSAFYEDERVLTTDDIKHAMDETLPLSVTMGGPIEALRQWASKHTRPASKPFDLTKVMEEKRRAIELGSDDPDSMDDLEIGEGPDL